MRLIRPFFLGLTVLSCAGLAGAETVFSESFNVAGPLDGRPAEVGSGTWNANVTAADGVVPISFDGFLNIDAPLAPGKRYLLSFDLINADGEDYIVHFVSRHSRVSKSEWFGNDSTISAYLKSARIETHGAFEATNAYHPSTAEFPTTYKFIIDLRGEPATLAMSVAGTPVSTEPLVLKPTFKGGFVSFLFKTRSSNPTETLFGSLDNISLTVLP